MKLRRSYQRAQGSGLGFLGSLLVETERDRERGEERESSAGKTVAANGQLIDKCAWMWMWMRSSRNLQAKGPDWKSGYT